MKFFINIHFFKKALPVIAIALFCCGSLHAQDSIQQKLSARFQQQYNFFSTELISQPLNVLSNFATIEAGAKFTGGNYRLSQDATKQKDYFFNTRGTKKVNKFLVSGSFAYTHTLQDSVRYTLRYGLTDPEPYYLYAAAPGNWQITKYDLSGFISRRFANDKLVAGAGAIYNVTNAWRSSDPRPEYFKFNISPSASLFFQPSAKVGLGIEGTFIKKSTESYIEYRNQDYAQGGSYPQYITHIQYGYGFTQTRPTTAIKNNTDGYRAQLIYNGSFGFGQLTAKGGYTNTTAHIYGSANVFDGPEYGTYKEQIWAGSIFWQYKNGDNIWSAVADGKRHLGKDYNGALNGNNYIYVNDNFGVSPLFTHYKNGRPLYEIGANIKYDMLSRTDGNKEQCAIYEKVDAAISGAYYVSFKQPKNFVRFGITAGISLPVGDSINVVRPLYEFATAVVYPDYYFNTAKVYTGKADMLYNFVVKTTNIFLRTQAQYQKASLKNIELPVLSMPGTNRWWFQLSAGITL